MFRIITLLVLSLLLSSCFYGDVERIHIWGFLDERENDADNYELVYFLDGDTMDIFRYKFHVSDLDMTENVHVEKYTHSYCNAYFRNNFFGCVNLLRGKHEVKILLKSKKSGNSYLLAEKEIDMDSYIRSVLITQIFFGSDTSAYEKREKYNIEWDRMKPLVLSAENDTIYHYTVKYWDKRDYYDTYRKLDEKYFIEVP